MVGIVLFVYTLFPFKFGPGVNFVGGFLYSVYVLLLLGTPLGIVPGILIMCVSRARTAPARSILFLLPGTTVGAILLSAPWALRWGTEVTSIMMFSMYVVGFSIGGLAAARFIPIHSASPRSVMHGRP